VTLFLLSIWCGCREFIDVVDYIRQLSLNIHWRFQGLKWLYFRCRFMDQQWHNVFDNSIHRPWLFFAIDLMRLSWFQWRCRFHTAAVTQYSLMIWRSTVTIFFADNLWISCDIMFLTIACVSHNSIFTIYLMLRLWIQWRYRFHTAVVTQYSLMISRSTVTLFSLPI